MTSSSQPPTLAILAEQVATLHGRLDRQQREIDDLRRENTRLRARSVERPDPDITRSSEQTIAVAAPAGMCDERMSRRGVLRRAASVAAGAMAAGMLLDQQTHEAGASHTNEGIDVENVSAHYVLVTSDTGNDGVLAYADTATENNAGVWGENNGTGPGAVGKSDAGIGVIGKGLIGVKGESSSPGYGANYGLHTDNGYGVVGDGHGAATSGVLGRNATGEGLRGEGKTGIRAKSTGSSGYGAIIEGGKAQLRIVPTTTTGKPTTGPHSKGELLLDSAATLWICTVGGTPGTWRKVSTTLA
jgi:hypothetical protein